MLAGTEKHYVWCVDVGTNTSIASMPSADLMEERFVEAALFGDKFEIWGWANAPIVAKAYTLQSILDNAREARIIVDALEQGLCQRAFVSTKSTLECIRDMWIPGQMTFQQGPELDSTNAERNDGMLPPPKPLPILKVVAPTLLGLLKWKTDEQRTCALEFRMIVALCHA